MTLLYVGLIGLGVTLVLSGAYNTRYITTVQNILAGQPLSTSSSPSPSPSAKPSNTILNPSRTPL